MRETCKQMKKELTDEQNKALSSLHTGKEIDKDAFNEIMKGTGIKIVQLSKEQKAKQEKKQKEKETKIREYVKDLQKRGKSARNIRRSVFMKYRTKSEIK